MKDDRVYLRHILECISRIEDNTGEGKGRFLSSHTPQDAVLRNPQTLEESTQRLSQTAKERHADTEWPRIAAFRNVLVHDYLGIDTEKIWEIVCRDIPKLKETVFQMLTECL